MQVKKVINYGDTKASAQFERIMRRPLDMWYEGDRYTEPGYVRYIWEKGYLCVPMLPGAVRYDIDVNVAERSIKYHKANGAHGFCYVCKNSDDFDELYDLIKSKDPVDRRKRNSMK